MKAQLNIFQRSIDDINDEYLCSIKAQLETKLESLKEGKNQFDELQADIYFLTDNSWDQFEIWENIENTFDELMSRAKELIISFENNKISDIKPVIIHTSNIKLPPINLLTFDGNYIHWRSFEDEFCAFVDKNESLSDVRKLCYLFTVTIKMRGIWSDKVSRHNSL